MEQISQQLPQAQPVASPPSRSSLWLLIVVVVTTILLILGGGGYYYFEMYRPAQYAKEVISLFEELNSQIQGANTQRLKDSNDYEGAIRVLEDQQAIFQQKKRKLASLSPPRTMKEFHRDFSRALDLLIAASTDAQKVASFIIKANKLYGILKPQDEPKNPTVGEFVTFWEERIAQAKIAAFDLFKERPPKADLLQFDKLKSTWEETEEGYGAALAYLKRQDPNMLVSAVSEETIPEAERAKIKKIDKIDGLLPLLEQVAREDAESLIKFSTTASLAGDELNTLGSKIDREIQELKEKYSPP